jgi:perosamine synthetase
VNRITLAAPDITDRERELVAEVLSGTLLSGGPMITRLESMLADFAHRKHAVAVSNGTAALHLIVRALGLGSGDAVITTPFSFVASANSLLFERCEPVFIDIEDGSFNLDPALVRERLLSDSTLRQKAKAILVVDVFGHPADLPSFESIAEEFGLLLIEDSAEALGSVVDGRPAGSFGEASIFAFYPNKQVTTGEGGAVLTDDDEIAALCRSMRNQGRGVGGEWLDHVRLGYNYRLSELHSALGVAQFERINELLMKRERVAGWYAAGLEAVPIFAKPQVAEGYKVAWFVYVVRLLQGTDRGLVMGALNEAGVPVRPYFPAIHLMPHYSEPYGLSEGDFPITEAVASSTLALPFHANMTEVEVEMVCNRLTEAIEGAMG